MQNSGLCPPASRSLTVLTTAQLIQLSTPLPSRILQNSGLCPPASLSLTVLTIALVIQFSCFARVLVLRHLRRRRRRRCRGPAHTFHSLGRRLFCKFVDLCCCRTWCHARCPCYYSCWCEKQDLLSLGSRPYVAPQGRTPDLSQRRPASWPSCCFSSCHCRCCRSPCNWLRVDVVDVVGRDVLL